MQKKNKSPRKSEVISRAELAAELGMLPGNLRAMEAKGLLPRSIHISSKHHVYRRSEIDAWIDAKAKERAS